MRNLFILVSVFICTFISMSSWAAGPSFQGLSVSDAEDIIGDFSGVLNHTSVSPASSLGKVFGFEFGFLGGVVETPGVERVSNAAVPGSDVKSLPHAALFGALSLPMGFTGEINFLPKLEADDVELKNNGLALKWTFTEVFPMPLDMAVKASVTKSELSFTQTTPITATIDFESTITELMFLASKNFILVEPYLGLGAVSSDGKLSSDQSAVFNPATNSVSKKLSGSHLLAGVNFNLLFFKIGLEAGKILDSQKVSAKFSFYF